MRKRPFSHILACLVGLLICTEASYAQWVKTSGPDSVQAFANGFIRLGPEQGYTTVYAGTRNGVYRTTDTSCANWVALNNGLTNKDVRALILTNEAQANGIIFAGTRGGGVFRSSDTGASWVAVNNGLANLNVRALAYGFSAKTLFAGTDSGVYRSGDSGASWVVSNNGLGSRNVRSLITSSLPSYVVAATDSGVFRSTDNGADWLAYNVGLTNRNVQALGSTDNILYAGTSAGIYQFGSSWGATTSVDSASNVFVPDVLAFSGLGYPANNVGPLAGTRAHGVLASSNGQYWYSVNQGLTDLEIGALAVSNNLANGYLVAGTKTGIWRRPVKDINSSWGAIKGGFGSPTRLRFTHPGLVAFTLPAASRVTLEVFAPDGQRAALLLSEDLPAGVHTRRLNTAALPNGLYFYRLRAGDLVETRKVMLSQ